jgi:hypothetical protein
MQFPSSRIQRQSTISNPSPTAGAPDRHFIFQQDSVRSAVPGDGLCAVLRPESISIGKTGDGMVAKVASSTYPGDKIEYSVFIGEDSLKIIRFDPPEPERFEAGEEVRIRFPREGVRLLPAKS